MISVIVPVYNTERYVGQCIESVLASAYNDFELILVNDGSTDRSIEVCRKYREQDRRIRLIEQKHMGVSIARNRGLRESRGEWIVFVDSDDLISPDFLYLASKREYGEYDLLLFDFMRPPKSMWLPVKTSYYKYHYFGAEDKTELLKCLLNMRQLVKGGNTSLCSPCAKVYKKSFAERYSIQFPADIAVGEDRIFNIKYLLRLGTCMYVQKPVYLVRSRPDSAMRSFSGEFLTNDMRYQEQLEEILKSERMLPLLNQSYENSVLTNMADVLVRGIFHPENPEQDAEKHRMCRQMEKNRIYRGAMRSFWKTGRMPRRVLLLFYKFKCYRVVEVICRVSHWFLKEKGAAET